MYIIKMTELFEKKFYKLIPKALQDQLWRRINLLGSDPYAGKPLGSRYLREMKLDKFRIYFTIFDDKVLVLLLDVSDKKGQQRVIDSIKAHKHMLDEYIKNLNSE